MEILHTEKEVQYYENLVVQAGKLMKYGIKYRNQELIDLSEKYSRIVQEKLDKYISFIRKTYSAPPSFLSKETTYRPGRILGNFYFNSFSKSVRCNFGYDRGGFDTHSLLELI